MKSLPPLEVGTHYRVQDFQGFEFGARSLRRAATGEDTAILHLALSNGTRLDIPAKDEDLHYLMRVLMEAFPQEALAHLKTKPWFPKEGG